MYYNNFNNPQTGVDIETLILKDRKSHFDAMSELYKKGILHILLEGLTESTNDLFVTNKSYKCTFLGQTYGLVFKLELSEDGGSTPALNNAVYPESKLKHLKDNFRGELIDSEYIQKNMPYFDAILTGVNDKVEFFMAYPDYVLAYMDAITEFVNECTNNGNNQLLQQFLERARHGFKFGACTFFPLIQATEVGFNFELEDSIRYRLKRDISFTDDDL